MNTNCIGYRLAGMQLTSAWLTYLTDHAFISLANENVALAAAWLEIKTSATPMRLWRWLKEHTQLYLPTPIF